VPPEAMTWEFDEIIAGGQNELARDWQRNLRRAGVGKS
jgi:hypothetical protein